jgi:hypothetical protein
MTLEEVVKQATSNGRTLFVLIGDRHSITYVISKYVLVIKHVYNNLVSVDSRFIDQIRSTLLDLCIVMKEYTLGDDTLINTI